MRESHGNHQRSIQLCKELPEGAELLGALGWSLFERRITKKKCGALRSVMAPRLKLPHPVKITQEKTRRHAIISA
jgi:hypothetical protein